MIRMLETCQITQTVLGGTHGFSPFNAVSISYGGECLVNAINLADFDDDPTQVLLCETCGNVGCGSVGWVHMRRIGDDVIWLPPAPRLIRDPDSVRELFPPPFMESPACGIPVFRDSLYDELRRQLSELPDKSMIPFLCAREALLLLQREAPLELLGRAPNIPRLQRDRILAVSDGDLEPEIAAINAFAKDHATDCTPLQTVLSDRITQPIEFHLDSPGFPAWRGFFHLPTGLGMIIEASMPSIGTKTEWILALPG